MNLIYFSSVTGNTARFAEKLVLASHETEGSISKTFRIPLHGIAEDLPEVLPSVLLIPSYGSASSAYVPPQVKRFLTDNPEHRLQIKGIIATGHRNFGGEYLAAGSVLAAKLNVPLLYGLELAGTPEDVMAALTAINHLARSQNQ